MYPILDHSLAEVNDHRQPEAGQTQVSKGLRLKDGTLLHRSFDFDDHQLVHEEVQPEWRRKFLALVQDGYLYLPVNLQALAVHLPTQRLFVG